MLYSRTYRSSSRVLLTLTTIILFKNLCTLEAEAVRDETFYEYPGVSAAEILTARGYQADEFFINTSTGCRLRITRGKNPMFANGSLSDKEPVLFVHGVLATANNFLINSFDAAPKDFSSINLRKTNLNELNKLLGDEPSARALPLLACNFGHEVWLLDRCGSTGSRETVGDSKDGDNESTSIYKDDDDDDEVAGSLTLFQARSFLSDMLDPARVFIKTLLNLGPVFVRELPLNLNARFWNFSLDEQARAHLPETIDFVLEKSGHTKLVLVGHSAGGAIGLMSESLFPDKFKANVSVRIYWAPAYSVLNNNPALKLFSGPVMPVFEKYVGPVLPTYLTSLVQATLSFVCSNPLARATICKLALELMYGQGGTLEPAKPQLLTSLLYTSPSHGLAQFAQQLKRTPHTMRAYDFGPVGNRRAYNSSEPPAYNLGRIIARPNSISIYASVTDGLVTLDDIRVTRSQLKVQHVYHQLDSSPYSHVGYFFNVRAPTVAIIPSMQEIETLAAA